MTRNPQAMTHIRHGTFLIFAMAVVTLLTVVVFAFVKAIELQRLEGGGTTSSRLAQEATLAGLRHAQEELVRDFNKNSIATIDAAGRASFRPRIRPYEHDGDTVDAGDSRTMDQLDVAWENRLIEPLWEERIFNFSDAPDPLSSTYDWSIGGGRGRWYEVEYRNRVGTTGTYPPDGTSPWFPWNDGIDTDGSRNGDVEGAAIVADIASPVCFDAKWNCLTIGASMTPSQARGQARYRLRYAVQVRDLDGTLLMNPDPEINWRDFIRDAPTQYTGGSASDLRRRRVAQHMHAILPVMTALSQWRKPYDTNNTPAALMQVYLGQGSGFNFARPSATDANPRPTSFPLMYRRADRATGSPQDKIGNVTEFVSTNAAFPSQLFADVSGSANVAGGDQLKGTGTPGSPMGHMLLGPQCSFFSLNRAAFPLGDSHNDAGGRNPYYLLQAATPFGRAQDGSGGATPYAGDVSTPWRINLLTAPPAVLRALVYGYLPAGVCGPLKGFANLFNGSTADAFGQYLTAQSAPLYPYPDEDTRLPKDRYPGAAIFNGNNAGTLANDSLGTGFLVSRLIPVLDPYTLTPIANGETITNIASNMCNGGTALYLGPATTDTPAIPAANCASQKSARLGPHKDSFWSDILMAFSNAVAIARRGHATQAHTIYDDSWTKASADPMQVSTWSPSDEADLLAETPLTKPLTMEQFDALFLACLGLKWGDPTAGTAYLWCGNVQADDANDIRGTPTRAVKYTTAAYSIKSVRDANLAANPEWAEGMELILNDFRLSFFGSDPAYAATFRPFDFSGDGKATCSGYAAGVTDTANGHSLDMGTLHYQAADFATHRGPAVPAPFCITGSFFIGRSHFWDITVRGEVYDNHLKRPISSATLQSTMVIDPTDQASSGNPGQAYATNVLYQRWFHNRVHSLNAK